MDLTRLTEELAQLLEKLRVESVEPTQFVETAEVAQAVEAARAGSLEGVRSHLAKVGAWALAAATAIGTAVAAAAIKAAAGI